MIKHAMCIIGSKFSAIGMSRNVRNGVPNFYESNLRRMFEQMLRIATIVTLLALYVGQTWF